MSKTWPIEINGQVAVLKLYKPPVNALDQPDLAELAVSVQQIEEDSAVRAVIITSSLKGVFCAGGDLKYWPQVYRNHPDAIYEAGRRAFMPIERLTKPSIAAIQGRVIGDGLSLALACDIVVAAKGSTFHLPEVEYGFIPGWGTIGRLVRKIGSARTMELLLLGEPVMAADARTMGLVSRVVALDDLTPTAESMAAQLAAKPPTALRYAKAAVLGRATKGLPDQEAWESHCFASVWGSEEWEEGIRKLFGATTVAAQEVPDEGPNRVSRVL